jgi:hypothetical protein
MQSGDPHPEEIDWSLTTWEGSRREQMRRWSETSLEDIILSIESMEEILRALAPPDARTLKEIDQAGGKNPAI